MNDLLNKISSYHVFNYLLPGIVFAVLAEHIVPYSLGQHDVIAMAFLYYFLGLVISRVGSLIVEPLLKRWRFVRFESYRDFVSASKLDPKLEVLSETNNTYRTLASMFFLLLTLEVSVRFAAELPHARINRMALLTILLLTLFLFSSYRKQSRYITKRIRANPSQDGDSRWQLQRPAMKTEI